MENVKEFADALNAKQAELTKAIEEKASKTEIETLKSQIEALKEINLKQGEEIAKLGKVEQNTLKGLTGEIMDALKSNADKIKNIKANKGRIEIELKSTVTHASVLTNTIGDRLTDIGQKPFRKVVLEDLFGSGNVSSQQIYYTDQENVSRDADNIALCNTAYPSTSNIEWKERSIKVEKIGDSIKVCLDAMEDFEFVASEVRNLLLTSVDLRADQQLLLGNGTSPELKGVNAVASTFAAGSYAVSIQNPNLYDLITVVGCQIAELGQGMYSPNYAILNPVDACLLKLQKDANDQYIIPPFTTENGMVVSGMRVIESTLVNANTMYVGDFTKGIVYNRKGLTVEMAMENEDDFNKDLVTIKASRRLALLIRNVHANAFTKVTDIGAALTAITKP